MPIIACCLNVKWLTVVFIRNYLRKMPILNECTYNYFLAENRQSYKDFDVSVFMEAVTTDQENKFRFRKNDKIKNRDAYEYNEKEDHTETAYKAQLGVKNLGWLKENS